VLAFISDRQDHRPPAKSQIALSV